MLIAVGLCVCVCAHARIVGTSSGAADEPAGRGAVREHDPADVGRAGAVSRRTDRHLRVVLQRLSLPPERPRDHFTAAQHAPADRPHTGHRLPHPSGSQVGTRRGRQHTHRASPHTRLRYQRDLVYLFLYLGTEIADDTYCFRSPMFVCYHCYITGSGYGLSLNFERGWTMTIGSCH